MADLRGIAVIVLRDLADTSVIGRRKLLRQEALAIADEIEQEIFQTRGFRNVLLETRKNVELLLSRQSKRGDDRDDLINIAEKLDTIVQRHEERGAE